MVRVEYDLYEPPITDRYIVVNGRLFYDTTVSPMRLVGWFDEGLKLGIRTLQDGQLYLDRDFTKPLFGGGIPDYPSTDFYEFFLVVPQKNAIIGVWRGKTNVLGDTPVIVAINRAIGALLIYNPSNYTISVNHYSDVYPNYETTGSYSNGVVTLSQGQYVLFYGNVKPTVNSNAPWGFTDYDPVSVTIQPSQYVDVTNGTAHYYYYSNIGINVILHYGQGTMLAEVNNVKVTFLGGLFFRMSYRNNRKMTEISYYPGLYGYYTNNKDRKGNIFIHLICDEDPPSGSKNEEGLVVDNVTYVRDSVGTTIIHRGVKHTTDPMNPRFSYSVAFRYRPEGTNTLRLQSAIGIRTYTQIKAQTPNPASSTYYNYRSIGIVIEGGANNTQFYYGTSTEWRQLVMTGSLYLVNYFDGYYAIGAEIYNPLNTAERYRATAVIKKHKRYTTPSYRVEVMRYTDTSPYQGFLHVTLKYDGATIPANTDLGMIIDARITTLTSFPNMSIEAPTEDTDIWTYLYGYPYNIQVSAPQSAEPGQTVNILVSTDAPDGTVIKIIDRDNNQVIGTATVQNGQATISFTMPQKPLRLRLYVEGKDISLS